MSTVVEQPTRKVKRKVAPVYDHQELAFDSDSIINLIQSKYNQKLIEKY